MGIYITFSSLKSILKAYVIFIWRKTLLTLYNIHGTVALHYCQKYGLTFLQMEEQSMLHIMFVLSNAYIYTVSFDCKPHFCDENLENLIFPFSGQICSPIPQPKVNHTRPSNSSELVLTNSALREAIFSKKFIMWWQSMNTCKNCRLAIWVFVSSFLLQMNAWLCL